ncbi:glycosyltransferase family 2 protein [Pedobacter sp. AW31-3R]|uniref:glycosyltransferase family 2 protein n=1 Tax=Pedobacter sp. AW31-3R TaxID=3445781 RepID=UPI003FA01DCA
MKLPLVSIIIPFYNSACYLADTIQSAIDQTWPRIEIILVDDGSTDHSYAVAEKFDGQYIKLLRQENKGAAAARNLGLKEAKGEYIQFLDADDLLSADKITAQVKLLQLNPEYIAVCSTVHFSNGADPFSCVPSAAEDAFLINTDPVNFLINLWGGYSANGSMVTVHAWLTPKSIIDKAGRWEETLSIDDDGEYFCRVLLQSKGTMRSEGYSYYRKYTNSNNLSAGKQAVHLRSQLNAMILKFGQLSTHTNSVNAGRAYLKSLHQFKFTAYPFHPDLAAIADREIEKTDPGFKADYQFPGKLGNYLKTLLGWKFTKYLQLLKQYLFKKPFKIK